MDIFALATATIHWSSVGAFWASMIAAIIAISATAINYLMFRSQIDPHVIVYVEADVRRPTMILLVIENIGRGLAKEIVFSSSKPLPMRAFGFEDAEMPSTMDYGPLITGIPSLGPGAKRIISWGQYGGIHKAIGDEVLIIDAKYKSDRIGPFDPVIHRTECPVDIKSFEGTDVSDSNWDQKAAQELKRIANAIDQWSSNK